MRSIEMNVKKVLNSGENNYKTNDQSSTWMSKYVVEYDYYYLQRQGIFHQVKMSENAPNPKMRAMQSSVTPLSGYCMKHMISGNTLSSKGNITFAKQYNNTLDCWG